MPIDACQAKPLVLIVEDELLILNLARMEFQEAGYEVTTAANSQTARDIIDSEAAIDLLFTDIRMPGPFDGWSLAKHARQVRPNIQVIYATGFSVQAPQLVDGGLLVTKPYLMDAVIKLARGLSL